MTDSQAKEKNGFLLKKLITKWEKMLLSRKTVEYCLNSSACFFLLL